MLRGLVLGLLAAVLWLVFSRPHGPGSETSGGVSFTEETRPGGPAGIGGDQAPVPGELAGTGTGGDDGAAEREAFGRPDMGSGVTFRVVGPHGEPVSHFTLCVTEVDGRTWRGGVEHWYGRDGTCTCRPKLGLPWLVEIADPRRSSRGSVIDARVRPLVLRQAPDHVVTLRLEEPWTLRGRLDAGVDPLPRGVRLTYAYAIHAPFSKRGSAEDGSVQIDDSGWFELAGIPVTVMEVTLRVKVPSGILPVGTFTARRGEILRIPIRRGHALEGRVVGLDRIPKGLRVLAFWEQGFQNDTGTNNVLVREDGTFTLLDVPADRDLALDLMVLDLDDIEAEQPLVAPCRGVRVGDEGVVVRVIDGLRIEGRVVPDGSTNGVEAENLSAMLFRSSVRWWGIRPPSGFLDCDENWALHGSRGLEPGDYDLVLQDGEGRLVAYVPGVPAGTLDVPVVLGNTFDVSGHVTLGGESTRARIQVWLEGRGLLVSFEATDASGAFSIKLPQGLAYALVARSETCVAVLRNVQDTAQDLELRLVPSGTIEGTFHGFESGVLIVAKNDFLAARTGCDNGRRFRLGGLPPGSYVIEAKYMLKPVSRPVSAKTGATDVVVESQSVASGR